jgi:hypothetical protein
MKKDGIVDTQVTDDRVCFAWRVARVHKDLPITLVLKKKGRYRVTMLDNSDRRGYVEDMTRYRHWLPLECQIPPECLNTEWVHAIFVQLGMLQPRVGEKLPDREDDW